jgi:hypothetical protein
MERMSFLIRMTPDHGILIQIIQMPIDIASPSRANRPEHTNITRPHLQPHPDQTPITDVLNVVRI